VREAVEAWDATAKVTLDRALLNELTSLRFLDTHAHVAIESYPAWIDRCEGDRHERVERVLAAGVE
jgi:hypothetical protein